MRRSTTLAVLLMVLVGLTSCRFDGIQNASLPGGVGRGDGAIVITAELPDVGTLTENAQVKMDDVAVGTVTKLKVVDWHAEATLSLKKGTRVPDNAVASVGVNSLLGSAYVELASPAGAASTGAYLDAGSTIPLERGHAYPSTEQVLSAASVVLNGGGLEQLSTITTELNRALGDDHQSVGDLIPRLDSFVSALNDQKSDIRAAIRHVDALAARFSDNRKDIVHALDELGPALEVLAKERPRLTDTLVSLRNLGNVAVPLVTEVKADLIKDLQDVTPALQGLAASGDSLTKALGFAVTFPFAPETVTNACRGDYCNLDLTLDLTNQAIVNGFIDPNGNVSLPGVPGVPDLSDIPLGQVVGNVVDAIGSQLNGVLGALGGGTSPAQLSVGRKGARR